MLQCVLMTFCLPVDSNRAPLAHLVSLDRSDNPSQYFDVQFVDASHPAPQPLPPKPASRYDINNVQCFVVRLT